MDNEGQWAAHIPHPLHEAEIVSAFFLLPTLIILMAAYGQRVSQMPHPIQVPTSTKETIGSTVTWPIARGMLALPAAAAA